MTLEEKERFINKYATMELTEYLGSITCRLSRNEKNLWRWTYIIDNIHPARNTIIDDCFRILINSNNK